MKTQRSRKPVWPRKITLGRVNVSVYKRTAPNGSTCYMVSNYADGKRRFDSYPDESLALEAAGKLARQLSEREVLAAAMTNGQASEYAASIQKIAPFNVGLLSAADAVANALKIIGGFDDFEKVKQAAAAGKPLPDLVDLVNAATLFHERQKRTTPKRVADVVTELLKIKKDRGASPHYLTALRSRLNRFAKAFCKDTCNVTTADIQAWLDGKKFKAQNFSSFRTVIHTFFEFAVARGYAMDNPAAALEKVKVVRGGAAIYSTKEIAKLLSAATPEFLPCIAIGAFAGLRSAEIERLEWADIDLPGGHIIVGAEKAKNASRRVIPINDNLAAWLRVTITEIERSAGTQYKRKEK